MQRIYTVKTGDVRDGYSRDQWAVCRAGGEGHLLDTYVGDIIKAGPSEFRVLPGLYIYDSFRKALGHFQRMYGRRRR